MKSLILPVFALLSLSSQALARGRDCVATAMSVVPNCAQKCILDGSPSIGCSGWDFACQCEHKAALMAAVEPCVLSACPPSSYQAIIDGASKGTSSRTQPTTMLSSLTCVLPPVCQCALDHAPTATVSGGVSGRPHHGARPTGHPPPWAAGPPFAGHEQPGHQGPPANPWHWEHPEGPREGH